MGLKDFWILRPRPAMSLGDEKSSWWNFGTGYPIVFFFYFLWALVELQIQLEFLTRMILLGFRV